MLNTMISQFIFTPGTYFAGTFKKVSNSVLESYYYMYCNTEHKTRMRVYYWPYFLEIKSVEFESF